eukprot:Skav208450  [mRNA]  locus=scaffold1104:47728:55635:+ [translate_table: standard]
MCLRKIAGWALWYHSAADEVMLKSDANQTTPKIANLFRKKFLSTSGGMGEALNVGFFATKPDRRLVDAAVLFAQQNSFDHNTGWGGAGWAPNGGYYVGGEHRRESLQHRQTVSRPPPTEEELRWAREGFGRVEQNIRIVDANQDRVYLKQGGQTPEAAKLNEQINVTQHYGAELTTDSESSQNCTGPREAEAEEAEEAEHFSHGFAALRSKDLQRERCFGDRLLYKLPQEAESSLVLLSRQKKVLTSVRWGIP